MPKLTLTFGTKSLGEYRLKKGSSITIGRRESNRVVIDDPAVSGHHAKIDSLEDRFVLIDLQSKNGSFVNEELVTSHWLKHGDIISIGAHCLVFEYIEKEKPYDEEQAEFDETQVMTSTQHRRMMSKSNPTRSISVVRFWDKPESRGKVRENIPDVAHPPAESMQKEPKGALTYLAGGMGTIEISRKITTVGKDHTSDIVVKGLLISPTAFTIHRRSDGFYLEYIGGLPRPKINDQTIKETTRLNDQDIIEIGSTRLQFSVENPADM
ncbi:MAG: FHA domain-containing protein [Deltaproteobacteria bacterium]|jgi:pSer/pThr/pTyr-binding forkhead associated (FHA) protein|nr:FHA domain-containing protein [Deltaproteobacteria bacterium]